MILLTTEPGDLVLDPFAGTGSVPVAASLLGRHGLGIDLNEKFVQKFAREGYASLAATAKREADLLSKRGGASRLGPLIVRLRFLKYPRTLFAELNRPDRLGKQARLHVHAFVVVGEPSWSRSSRSTSDGRLGEVFVTALVREGANVVRLRETVDKLMRVPPLSKFGLNAHVNVLGSEAWQSAEFSESLPRGRWYLYTRGAFNTYRSSLKAEDVPSLLKALGTKDNSNIPPILSPILVDVPQGIIG